MKLQADCDMLLRTPVVPIVEVPAAGCDLDLPALILRGITPLGLQRACLKSEAG